uniref:Uncharacterized protein n=1 Tax=Solanum lycopersicum TaxID=4081 RepID=A0A3Q7J8X7_SOLLC
MKNNNVLEPKKKTEEIQKKRPRKVTSTVSRPTLPKVDSKFKYLVNLIKAKHIEVMNSKNREDDQQSKDMGEKSTPNMVEVFDEEGNDGHQATSPIQMELDVNNQDAPSAQTPHHLFEGTMNEDTLVI